MEEEVVNHSGMEWDTVSYCPCQITTDLVPRSASQNGMGEHLLTVTAEHFFFKGQGIHIRCPGTEKLWLNDRFLCLKYLVE